MRFLILFILLLPLAHAEIDILDADKATLNLEIRGSARFVGQSSNAYLSEAEAELSWIPRETWNQKILSYDTTPEATVRDTAIYHWDEPSLSTHTILLEAELETNNGITPISKKPPFPVQVSADLIPYTRPSKMIDTNADINRLASQLAAGKDDQYEVVFAFADWVTTNIDYDLNTMTADAVYPSSWVLEQRRGVCDEMTNLFISLNRAVGIPARFVSGLAYTDLDALPNNWGGHGWAEVYFPEVGWVPFDVTYGEYGYVDSGHIKLKDTIDSEETSIEFRAKGYDFDITSQPLEFTVDVLDEHARNYEFIDAELTSFAKEVRFGSYNLLTLRIKNLREYYISTRVELGETTQLHHETPDHLNVLLKPFEEREFHFLIRVDKNLDRRYLYTFPVAAFTKLSEPAEDEFKATSDGPFYDQDIFESYFREESVKDADVTIDCDAPSPVKEATTITCTFSTKRQIRGDVCIAKDCELVTLKTSYVKNITYSQDKPGIYTIPVSFSNYESQANQFVTVQILDDTKLEIRNIELPETIKYGEPATVQFTVVRTSESAPTHSRVLISHDNFEHSWELETLPVTSDYELQFTGDRLKAGDNTITFAVDYTDAFGQKQRETRIQKISLVDLTLKQRLSLWIDALDRWLQGTLT